MLDTTELEDLLGHWRLTPPVDVRRHGRGPGSSTWLVTAGAKRFIAKLVHDQRRYVEPGLRVASLVDAREVPTGPPLATLSGDLCVEVTIGAGSHTLALLRFVPGHPLDASSHEAPAIAGALLGRVHAILRRDSRREWVPADLLEWCESHAAASDGIDEDRAQSAIAAVRRLRRRRRLTFAVVYGDPSPEILVDVTSAALIDWGTPSWGPLLHDVACWLVFFGALRSEERRSRFVESYRHNLPLTSEELDTLPVLHELAAALKLHGD